MSLERLQKILAHAGVASRRACEELIVEGRVRVNGRVVTELGTKAHPHKDRIEVDGRRVVSETHAYYIVHKPREMVTTMDDPEGRNHLGELLGKIPERVYPVGRLDYHTSGVLLVTNDGDLTEALLHPKKSVPKIYAAKLRGHLDVPELDKLRNGVELDDGYVTRKAEVFVLREEKNYTWVQITLREGKNRQIHRMGEGIGHPVSRLVRLAFAGLTADGLRPGQYRPIKARELAKLKKNYAKKGPVAKAGEEELEFDFDFDGEFSVATKRGLRRPSAPKRTKSSASPTPRGKNASARRPAMKSKASKPKRGR